ncbi:ribosomal protein S18-alanine N-acetyltransferase [Corynebacterium sp. HS2168-gen11]|uniref:ribosomal protein S18-alanine N-acetyltransferase n=1 Tax=Corynebacterium sp. HS2168-gen11 TaxID=2974027 RepID=UPI00216AFD28|nr:ribosomal protein S18-alanine N-acetyltransferase [Corynebacterium sp. HS2168-gen11]MCS4535637.1 ribosomal protein S18-alanine N-acetyltransferase [Corynebacterium sp. HS2168-gen11]
MFKLVELGNDAADRLAQLEQLLFIGENPWTRQDFLAEFSQPHTVYLGVVDQAADPTVIIGYVGIATMGPAGAEEMEIHTIGVDPAYQRRGVATLLMDEITQRADFLNGPIFLEVRHDNTPAISLYQRYGFVQIGLRRNYYQPSGADAYTMIRQRKSEQ